MISLTTEAVVTRIINPEMAEVVVTRGTACGGSCGSCEACVFENEIKTEARNIISAFPGQKVLLETESRKFYIAAFMVYILPFIFFFIGYAVASALGAAEGICMLVSALAFIAGIAYMVYRGRRQKEEEQIKFSIISLLDD